MSAACRAASAAARGSPVGAAPAAARRSSGGVAAALTAPARAFSATIPYPTTPHSKAKLETKRERPVRNWRSVNAPALTNKFLRFAERQARELGVADDIAAFDAAAAAFPNPSPIIVNTLLERPAVIVRDVEPWESDFLAYADERRQAEAKAYPQTLIDMFTASSTVMEGAARGDTAGGADAAAPADAAAAADGGDDGGVAASSGGSGGTGTAADTGAASLAASSGARLDDFYEAGGGAEADASESRAGVVLAPRTTAADGLDDTRSLDRAYAHRLLLLVKEPGGGGGGGGGGWTLPGGPRLDGERMAAGAERCLRAAWGAGDGPAGALDAWYVGAAPCGHWLEPFDAARQAATGSYGAKHFLYRAELIAGKFRAPAGGDWAWVTRDEAEALLPRPLWKYVHQVAGAGPGEEGARRAAWSRRVAAAGLSVGAATGRRAHRVATARGGGAGAASAGGARLPAVATRAQADLAAARFGGGGAKAGALRAEVAAYAARVRSQRAASAAVAAQLATPTAAARAAAATRERAAAAAAAAPGARAALASTGGDAVLGDPPLVYPEGEPRAGELIQPVKELAPDDPVAQEAAAWAVGHLAGLSDSGVYTSLRLRRVLDAATQEGVFHNNTMVTVELESPHFLDAEPVSVHKIIVMADLEDGVRSFAIDEFPVMEPDAVEEFWTRKVERARAARAAALIELDAEFEEHLDSICGEEEARERLGAELDSAAAAGTAAFGVAADGSVDGGAAAGDAGAPSDRPPLRAGPGAEHAHVGDIRIADLRSAR